MASLQYHLLHGLLCSSSSSNATSDSSTPPATLRGVPPIAEHEAARRLQRAMRNYTHKNDCSSRRPRKRARRAPRRTTSTTVTATTTTRRRLPRQQPLLLWLWRSLRAYAQSERSAALQLLWQSAAGCNITGSSNHTNNPHEQFQWLQRYCLFLEDIWEKTSNSNENSNISERDMELCAVLHHLVMRSLTTTATKTTTNTTATNTNTSNAKDSTTTENINNNNNADGDFECRERTARVLWIWPWLCRQVYHHSSHCHKNTVVLTALARLAVQLVLVQTSTILSQSQTAVASSATNTTELEHLQKLNAYCVWNPRHCYTGAAAELRISPLACFLGAHFFATPNRDFQQLMDPTRECRVVAVDPSSNKDKDKPQHDHENNNDEIPNDSHDEEEDDDDDDGDDDDDYVYDGASLLATARSGPKTRHKLKENDVKRDNNNNNGDDTEEDGNEDGAEDEDHSDDNNHNSRNDEDDEYDDHHENDGTNSHQHPANDSGDEIMLDDNGHVVLEDPMDLEGDDDDEDDEDDDDMDDLDGDVNAMLLVASSAAAATRTRTKTMQSLSNHRSAASGSTGTSTLQPTLAERRRLYVTAAMQILAVQQQQQLHHAPNSSSGNSTSHQYRHDYIINNNNSNTSFHQWPTAAASSTSSSTTARTTAMNHCCYLDHIQAENELLKSVGQMIRPEQANRRQLLGSMQIILRRAPTQEEFFRGSLSRNPVPCSLIMSNSNNSGGNSGSHHKNRKTNNTGSFSSEDPTVADLRQHIANDLQMADSAELIEIIMCNKILNVNLKLRVVQQVLWKNHLLEHGSSSGTSGTTSIFASGTSIILSSGQPIRITPDTPAEALPPMVAMYRLAGVDGEATEDTVDDLPDPEAFNVATASPYEIEQRLEREYGITRSVSAGRGVAVLLRAVQNGVHDALRRIRRDQVDSGCLGSKQKNSNRARQEWGSCPPCEALLVLQYCTQLPCNRKLLLQARAPTVLLQLLLEVLKVLEDDGGDEVRHSNNSNTNPTTEILQELIESLTSDISLTTAATNNIPTEMTTTTTSSDDSSNYESDGAQDAASMPLLLQSIETISLSPPLRCIIAKLLPFLTYGQVEMSRELARHFCTHIDVEALGRVCEKSSSSSTTTGSSSNNNNNNDNTTNDPTTDKEEADSRSAIWMNTFVQTAVTLPANSVCNSLRLELGHGGLVERLVAFVQTDLPSQPPPWSPALWAKGELPSGAAANNNSSGASLANSLSLRHSSNNSQQRRSQLEEAWRNYYQRDGVQTALQILTGLCRQHAPTQIRMAQLDNFLRSCHWLEGTSDSSMVRVETAGKLGLLAETLLDELTEGNDQVRDMVQAVRQMTQWRKKELAQERRQAMLSQMSTFRPTAMSSTAVVTAASTQQRSGLAAILAPVVGLFQSSSAAAAAAASAGANQSSRGSRKGGRRNMNAAAAAATQVPEKPAWLAEAEMMEDETGLTCAVCQEGRTLQPTELLGIYAYVKKIAIPLEHCGARASIDGFNLLKSLPSGLPLSLFGSAVEEWFITAKTSAETLSNSSLPTLTTSSGSGRRNSIFTSTVSAGTGIHHSCHRRARQADRLHPKAPKAEWDGATLRNNRVSCNVILPLVSSRSSKVPLTAVETALSEHTNSITNMLGVAPKSLLWTVLHDVRLLLLRIAYGESLSADCGGGSLASNLQLVFYQFLMADMFDKEAQASDQQQSRHARGLAAGLLSACAIVTTKDAQGNITTNSTLMRAIADAAPMASITSLVFHNHHGDGMSSTSSGDDLSRPHPKRQWLAGKDYFLRALLICAGRRHAKGIDGSGCQTQRSGGSAQNRSSSFADWSNGGNDSEEEHPVVVGSNNSQILAVEMVTDSMAGRPSRKRGHSSGKPTVEDFRNALRPMIVYFAIVDALSSEFAIEMNDQQIEVSAQRLASIVSDCQRARSIQDLLRKAQVTLSHEEILDLLQKGMVVAY